MNNIKDLIWYEKYRPKKLSNLILDKHTKKNFKKYIKLKEIPHLLFFGSVGSGKTTLSNILISKCASSSLYINTALKDTRGIVLINETVGNFAKIIRRDKSKINIVVISEAHRLTRDAQEALNDIIETYQKNCRFIFTTNFLDRIPKAIRSRCIRFKFDSLPKDNVLENCITILEKEKIEYNKKDLNKIIDRFYPDIRSIINEMQSCSISGKLDLKYLGDPEIDLEKFNKLLEKGKINDIRHLWADSSDFGWLWQHLMDQYIPNIKNNEKAANCALSVADYMNRFGDREINATACIVEILLELDKQVYF